MSLHVGIKAAASRLEFTNKEPFARHLQIHLSTVTLCISDNIMLGMFQTLILNFDSPNLGSRYFIFLGGGS